MKPLTRIRERRGHREQDDLILSPFSREKSNAALSPSSLLVFHLGRKRNGPFGRVRPLSSTLFDEILIDGAFDIYLSQSKAGVSSPAVEVEATLDAQPHVMVQIIDGHVLSIHLQGSVNIESNVYLFIRFRSPLRRLTIEGTGNLITDDDGIETSSLEKLVFDHRGSVNVALRVNVSDFEYNLTGAGNVRFSGQVREQASLLTKGIGDVHALTLLTKQMKVLATGMHILRIQATEDVQIEVTGNSYVYYKLPMGVQASRTISTGSGKILRIN